jgi:hypothetical protein
MNEPIDWAHRESLRQWAILAARGHEGAQAVAAYHGLVPPAILPPAPAPVSAAPAAVRAVTPRAPRAVVPAAPKTPALDGVSRRVDMLTRLITPPVPPDLF